MLYQKDFMPQFRDADESGLIGARGYMNYLQDAITEFMHEIGKGNDTLPEEYGIVWMYDKCRIHVEKKADFTGHLQMETWPESRETKAAYYQDFTVSRNGEVYAEGRVETCLYDLEKKDLTRLNAIDLPEDLAEERSCPVDEFSKFPNTIDGMSGSVTHPVVYTDLDKTGHMTNLRYVELLLDAFSSSFYRQFLVTDLEIHFLKQCYEGEMLTVLVSQYAENGFDLAVVKMDGTVAIQARMEVRKR